MPSLSSLLFVRTTSSLVFENKSVSVIVSLILYLCSSRTAYVHWYYTLYDSLYVLLKVGAYVLYCSEYALCCLVGSQLLL